MMVPLGMDKLAILPRSVRMGARAIMAPTTKQEMLRNGMTDWERPTSIKACVVVIGVALQVHLLDLVISLP
jgi:hypothetical protein